MLLPIYTHRRCRVRQASYQPARRALVSRDISVPDEDAGAKRGPLDHLFLDQDGAPTLVEVKRSSDTRIRREVVGQLIDYAANAVAYSPVERIQASFDAVCMGEGRKQSSFRCAIWRCALRRGLPSR